MEQYANVQQLMKKEDGHKDRKPVYPPTVIQAVFDGKTGASLEAILAQFNSIYVQYQGTPKDTRLVIPMEMRRAGLTITYMNMENETITERASSAVQKDNDHWGLDTNWSRVDELSLSGDIAVSASGTWIINGEDTGIPARGSKGDTGLTPWLKTVDNKLHFSYDNEVWEPCSENIAAWFRWSGNKIQISRDNKTWTDLSGKFADNVHIKGYVATTSALPSNAAQGDIYGVGPTYAESDTAHTNPIYRYYVRNANSWVDNGSFTSISAGVVQETGNSETEVMSQKAVSEKLSELGSKKSGIVFTANDELNGAIKELYIDDKNYSPDNIYYFTAFQRNYYGNNKSAIRIGVNNELETIIFQTETNYDDVRVHTKQNERMFFRIVVDWGKLEERIARDKTVINHCAFNKLYSPTLYSDEIKENVRLVDYDFQSEICESYEAKVGGWGNISVERGKEIDYFGETIVAEKVTVDSASSTGNMMTFVSEFNIKSAVGKKVNFCILFHSEIDAVLKYTLYPNVGTIDANIINIKKGWNKIHATAVIDKEYTSNYAIQFIVVENQAFVGTTIHVKGVWYLGEKKTFIPNLKDIFVTKEVGKVLISADTLSKVESINYIDICRNVAKEQSIFSKIGSGFTFESTDEGLHVKKEAGVGSESDNYAYINYLLDKGIAWEKNHDYYIAIDMVVNSDSFITSLGFYDRAILAKYTDPITVGTTNFIGSLQQGIRGLYKAKVTIDKSAIDEYPTANHIFFQFGKYATNDYFDGTIYGIYVSDLGEIGSDKHIDWDEVNSYIAKNGFKDKKIVEECITANKALVAEKVLNNELTKEIDLWGDSLTAQPWNNYLEEILGRKVYAHGYGGKTSTYIRDLYLSNLNKDRTQVIWVGRNNYTETDVVIDDVRDMVAAFGSQNFIVMSPPNGDYGTFGEDGNGSGEMKNGDSYKKFIELEERLSQEYPSNYLNIRKAVIQGWRMGNIKLMESFTQPNIGDAVQIAVSNADFLTTYNSKDLEGQGESFMKKIRIGINGKYDVYSIVSKDDSTHLTVKLEVANYKQPNETVSNITDSGDTNAIKYLRVMQNADYMCWLNDTTLSTYRSDRIHITEDGRKLVAEIVARKIKSMGI